MTRLDPAAGAPASVLEARRSAATDALGKGVMVLPSSPLLYRSRDTEHRHRPDSELFYLTGVTMLGAVAVLSGGDEPRYAVFVRERDEEVELWSGPSPGPEAAAELYGADEARPLSELDERLPELLARADAIHYRVGRGDALERLVLDALVRARTKGQRQGTGPRRIVDPGEILDELRLVKDAHELDRIRSAAEISARGHRAAAAAARPGAGEWEVEAVVDATFRSAGAEGPAFPTIVGSGANACVLHYVENRRTIGKHDLVVVDAGAEVGLYSGDVTRTLPADGIFTARQRAVYEVVEEARAAAVAAVRPGTTVADVHRAALERLVEGLVDLGVLDGPVDTLIEEEAYKPYYPHQTSHWLGLDVHDPGDYARNGSSRALAPGMTLTVEPGLYFRPGQVEDAGARFAGIGVRIEDDVVVTEDGAEVLTAELPTAPDAIEALMAEEGPRDVRGG